MASVLIRISAACHAVCKLNEYFISSNLISWLSEVGVAKIKVLSKVRLKQQVNENTDMDNKK